MLLAPRRMGTKERNPVVDRMVETQLGLGEELVKMEREVLGVAMYVRCTEPEAYRAKGNGDE